MLNDLTWHKKIVSQPTTTTSKAHPACGWAKHSACGWTCLRPSQKQSVQPHSERQLLWCIMQAEPQSTPVLSWLLAKCFISFARWQKRAAQERVCSWSPKLWPQPVSYSVFGAATGSLRGEIHKVRTGGLTGMHTGVSVRAWISKFLLPLQFSSPVNWSKSKCKQTLNVLNNAVQIEEWRSARKVQGKRNAHNEHGQRNTGCRQVGQITQRGGWAKHTARGSVKEKKTILKRRRKYRRHKKQEERLQGNSRILETRMLSEDFRDQFRPV